MAGFNRPLDLAQQIVAVNGSPVYVTTVAATTTPSLTSPAALTGGGNVIMIQPDAAVYYRAGVTGAASDLTSANGVLLAANEKFITIMDRDETAIQLVAVSTANVKIFQLR